MLDNDVQNCYPYYPEYPYYPTTPATTNTFYFQSFVDKVKSEAMRLALEAKPNRPFKEVAKLAAQIEEYLRA